MRHPAALTIPLASDPTGRSCQAVLVRIHNRLRHHYGELHWWPAKTPFEVVIGAILTQNTAWRNVEYALANLAKAGPMNAESIAAMPLNTLEQLIRPSGFFRQKARRLRDFSRQLLAQSNGDIAIFCQGPLDVARNRLLKQSGIGPETADSILLYATGRPSFVVDAYTRRIFQRIGVLHGHESYDAIRGFFMTGLPQKAELFNAYHAEIVVHAKTFCRKTEPRCAACPIVEDCTRGRDTLQLT